VKPKPAQEVTCSNLPTQVWSALSCPRLQILEIFRVIGAKPHHHGKVADLGGAVNLLNCINFSACAYLFFIFVDHSNSCFQQAIFID